MKPLINITLLAFALSAPLHAEDDKTTAGAEIAETAVVESGTYKGTAHKVDPEEKEIYVKLTDGKIIELYLKSKTKLTQGDKDVEFDALKEGQNLEIEVEKKGEKLKPISVKILE
jgi:hypothetical protein